MYHGNISILVSCAEISSVTAFLLSFLILSGHQIKVFSMILHKFWYKGILMSTLNKGGSVAGEEYARYKGANILEQIMSYYQNSISAINISSL